MKGIKGIVETNTILRQNPDDTPCKCISAGGHYRGVSGWGTIRPQQRNHNPNVDKILNFEKTQPTQHRQHNPSVVEGGSLAGWRAFKKGFGTAFKAAAPLIPLIL